LYSNHPNPFTDKTNIVFDLPISSELDLTIHDMQGKVVYQRRYSLARGPQNLEVLGSELGVSGVLYYTISTSKYAASGKMIRIE